MKIYGNVMNEGHIANLPDGVCVEVPCSVDRRGIEAQAVGDIPAHLAAINQTQINVQRLAVKAALESDPEMRISGHGSRSPHCGRWDTRRDPRNDGRADGRTRGVVAIFQQSNDSRRNLDWSTMPELVNLGSLCIDFVYSVPSIVRPGETLLGAAPVKHAGGKGLNQSLAAARAGARVAHFGCVGVDGTWLIDLLAGAGVDVDGVRCCETHPTGHAMIQVGAHGENAIVIVAGANHHIQPDDVARAIARVGRDGWLLMQNEINDIDDILAEARRAEVRVALNIAPVDGREAGYRIDAVELLLLNELEAAVLAREEDPHRAARAPHARTSEPARRRHARCARRALRPRPRADLVACIRRRRGRRDRRG